MLKRIETIQGIGLLHNATGYSHTWEAATLIYSDNGRGKSTLASLLRSVSTDNASLINDRKTVDGSLAPKAVLQFNNGQKISFADGKWSQQRPEISVFDSNFIEKNVHSGNVVNTEHRKNLLEFALGEAAVNARTKLETATTEAKIAADTLQNITNQLSPYHPGISLQEFEELPPIEDIEMKIVGLEKRIAAANSKSLMMRLH